MVHTKNHTIGTKNVTTFKIMIYNIIRFMLLTFTNVIDLILNLDKEGEISEN